MIDLATIQAPEELHPIGKAALKTPGYDPLQEEPDFDLIVRARRQPLAAYPHSDMYYGYALEGVVKPALSQKQADYMAAMLRHAANLIQGAPAMREGDPVLGYARQLRVEAKAAFEQWVGLVHKLARSRDTKLLASQLGMDPSHIHRMKKGRAPQRVGLRP